MISRGLVACLIAIVLAAGNSLDSAPPPVPNYEELRLESVYPAGGQRGTTVAVSFGASKGGLADAREIVIDGPPGITVQKLENNSANEVTAELVLASDAPLGKRMMRIRSDRCGLTNMLYFSVGRHPEVLEPKANDDLATAPLVELPAIFNGRLDPAADVDCVRFAAKAGQQIVALVAAQALDSHGQGKDYGYVDAEVQILDSSGRVLSEAQDTLGLDPLAVCTIPADGVYAARVQQVLYRGYPQAVYRLSLGELPVVTSVFPPGGPRGGRISLKLSGPNVPTGLTEDVVLRDEPFPVQGFLPQALHAADWELPLLRSAAGTSPAAEQEPNDVAVSATPCAAGGEVFGDFHSTADVDWFRLSLDEQQSVCVETCAHRHLRAPVDTIVTVFDAGGKPLADNDDGFTLDYLSAHDFQPPDSRLVFTAATAGDYFLRVANVSGHFGPRAVYRLSVSSVEPDFELHLYPDGVPIWGPGTTAAVLVRGDRLQGMKGDIELSVEGLPDGWTGSRVTLLAQTPERPGSTYYAYYGTRAFLTISAPATASVGDMAPLRVVGRATAGERKLERIAQPNTWYYTSDIGFFRQTPVARAVVAGPRGPWLSAIETQLRGKPGEQIMVPVRVAGDGVEGEMSFVVNLATSGVACSLMTPATVPVKNGRAEIPLKIPAELPLGTFSIVAARTWQSDIRVGMPGPCTTPIDLTVLPR